MDSFDILISDFLGVARLAGLPLTEKDISHQALSCPHRPVNLPGGHQAVYVFWMPAPSEMVLKVGKVGPNSSARFISQHYSPGSSQSNLSKSLLSDLKFWSDLHFPRPDEIHIGEWIKKNTCRDNFYMDSTHGSAALALLEIFLQCRLNPRYEG